MPSKLIQNLSQTSLSKIKVGKQEDFAALLDYTKRKTTGIKTGLVALDSHLRGLQGIVGILGGPKVCKSTFALQVAMHNASQGNPVLFIDRENGLSHMNTRMLCYSTEFCWGDFCKLNDERKKNSWGALHELPLYLHTGAFNSNELEDWVDAIIEQMAPEQHCILVLDSLHKLPMEMENVRISVDRWLLFLDHLKLKHNRKLVILTTIEKRRGSYDEATRDGGKESGRIEYTLEQQLDLRPLNPDVPQDGIELTCTYNRHGPAGDKMHFKPMYARANDKWSFLFKLKELEGIDL